MVLINYLHKGIQHVLLHTEEDVNHSTIDCIVVLVFLQGAGYDAFQKRTSTVRIEYILSW